MKKLLLIVGLILNLFSFGQEKHNQSIKKITSSELNNPPIYPDSYFKRGGAQFILSQYDGAIGDFTKAIEINPNDAESYFFRGMSKAKLKDDVGAILDYSKAIEIDPGNSYYFKRGVSKENLKDYRGAILDYSMAVKIEPANTEAFFHRGLSKSQLEDDRGAIVDFNIAIMQNYGVIAYYSRGLSKLKLKDSTGAIFDFTKVILDANTKLLQSDAYFFRGICKLMYTSQKDSGCLDLSKAGELGNENAYKIIKENCN
jgi:tetratricopeptide (TPR) repeat protein